MVNMRCLKMPCRFFVLACILTVYKTNCLESVPRVDVLEPGQDSRIPLPARIRYSTSTDCYTQLFLDGILVFEGSHEAQNGYTVDVMLETLSLEDHEISIDLVDAFGNVLVENIASSTFTVIPGHQVNPSDSSVDNYYEEEEEYVEYNPNLTDEERAGAVLKDGWLLMMNSGIEFMRIEPTDTCQDLGWTERERPLRIFDAFQFFNELDILEIRLHELEHVVHRFVLVEATRTHSNQPKPLHYALNKERFARFADRIIHVVVDDLPNSTDPWTLENFQRNALMRGLASAHPNDLVVVADVDEVPSAYVLDALRRCRGASSPAWLYSRFFNFKFRWEFAGLWKHPQVARVATLARVSPQRVRMGAMRAGHTAVEAGGWHCSFFGDADAALHKVAAFTHQELNTPAWLDRAAIAAAMEEGRDYFNADMSGRRNLEERHGGLQANPSCHGLPRHVLAHADRFAAWLPDCRAAHGHEVDLVTLASPPCFGVPLPGGPGSGPEGACPGWAEGR